MRQHPPLYKHFSPSVAPRAGGLAFALPAPGGWGCPPGLAGKAGHVPFFAPSTLVPPRLGCCLSVGAADGLCLLFGPRLTRHSFLGRGAGAAQPRAERKRSAGGRRLRWRAGSAAAQPKERSEAASPSRGRAKRSGRAAVGSSPRRQSRRRQGAASRSAAPGTLRPRWAGRTA